MDGEIAVGDLAEVEEAVLEDLEVDLVAAAVQVEVGKILTIKGLFHKQGSWPAPCC